MNLNTIAILAFVILEFLNVIILYFFPSSKKGNGIGVFSAYEKSKEIPEVHALVNYLINWVAGTKLIFITLLIVIIFKADEKTQLLSLLALIFSILSFYWKLFPAIKKMDKKGQLNPKGYSKMLGGMILSMVVFFAVVLLISQFQ